MTDTHCTGTSTARDDACRRAVAYADSVNAHAIINTGDIGNDLSEYFIRPMAIYRTAKAPLLWCNGNHSEWEDTPGIPTTSEFEAAGIWNMSAPFYWTVQVVGDAGEKVRAIMLDSCIYADSPLGDRDSPNHVPGDRIGRSSEEPLGGYYRQFGTAQLAWIRSTLAVDVDSDYILLMFHYPPTITVTQLDFPELADELDIDGRPVVALCGHIHGHAKTYTLSSNANTDYTVYKMPGALESNCYCDFRIDLNNSVPSISNAEVMNYTQPDDTWAITAPFTVGSELRILRKL